MIWAADQHANSKKRASGAHEAHFVTDGRASL
jgi:hypothetical protein